MKKIYFIVLFSFFIPSLVFAQNIELKKISPSEEEFTMIIPDDNYQDYQYKKKGEFLSGLYKAYSKDVYYFVASYKNTDVYQSNAVIDFAKLYDPVGKEVFFGNIKGTKYSFEDSEHFFNEIISVITQKRIYTFHILSENKDNLLNDKSISSIEFSENSQNKVLVNTNKKPTKSKVDSTNKTTSTADGKVADSNQSDKSNGIGFTYPDLTKLKVKDSALKILAKPRPPYTELAREYNFQGFVMLRVTFLENGKIGDVSAVEKIPLGLTDNAIKAVRSMRFVSAIRGGKPFSVVKIVQYNFSIY